MWDREGPAWQDEARIHGADVQRRRRSVAYNGTACGYKDQNHFASGI